MSLTNKLLRLAAKVALDKLIGETRTDALDKMLQDWAAERDKARELAEAQRQAADTVAVSEAVETVIAGAGRAVTGEERIDLEVAVAARIATLDDPSSEEQLRKTFLPGKSKVYVILSDDSRMTGDKPSRFFHFSWDNEGYRIRDYLESRILHPPDRKPGKESLTPVALGMSALEVWNASNVRIHSVAEFGLGFGKEQKKEWKQVLHLLTESAKQIRGK
ncbi:hypothetical protein [Singulisphaera sp. PoT]|uniref:hypothetical protein n=1 Tax=Singulisphaera sp. PoT TaxID=3411797 RepID=UPI003BF551EC